MIKTKLLAFYLVLGFFSTLWGQNTAPVLEWQRCFGSSGIEAECSMVATPDGGYIYLAKPSFLRNGDLTNLPTTGNVWVVKLSATREIEWQKILLISGNLLNASINKAADGGYIIAGTSYKDLTGPNVQIGNDDVYLIKLSPTGAIQWEKTIGGSGADGVLSVIPTTDGGFVFAGYTSSNDGDVTGRHTSWDSWVVKISALGAIQWQKSWGGSAGEFFRAIIQTSDGGFAATGRAESNDGDIVGNHNSHDAWVVKMSATGVLQWQKCLGGSAYEQGYGIIQTQDEGFAIVSSTNSRDGDVDGLHGYMDDAWVVKLSATGVLQWQKCLGGTKSDGASAIVQTRDGEYIIAGGTSSEDGDVTDYYSNGDGWVVRLSAQGTLLWQKCLGGSASDQLNNVFLTPDGGYLLAGSVYSNNGDVSGNHGISDIWLVKLSSDAKVITGQVQRTNAFCQSVSPPQYIANSKVKIEKNNAIYYVSTDSLSRYRVIVDTGSYTISAVPPNNLWAVCSTETTIISNPRVKEIVIVNPNLTAVLICPLMETQLTTPFLRRCFESVYTINYANRGTAIQTDATAELTLDSMLNFVSATRPVRSRVGNKIVFSVGNVGINQSGQFDVKVLVSCNSQIGQTHCSSVLIPKTMSCDTVQDSIPTIVNQCVTGCDSISFLVTRPNSALNKTFKYQLIADATLLDTGRFSMTNAFNLKHKRDGRTYRFEVRNAVTNQLLAARSAETDPSVSSGFVNQFSQSIKQTNIAENCTMNRGSFDPNDKSAVPTGIGTRRFIEQGKDIEYLVQFQNTGTDTAFTVVVKDTLAPHFNLATFKLNASSHISTWQLNPKGVLIVTFNNINLVDSFTNEKKSHGFFKYAIKLNDSIVTNTIIANKAAIYFDFNDPIITNLTTHTIGKEALKNCLLKPKLTVNYSGCPSRNIAFNAVSKDAGLNPTFAWYRNAETGPLSINANFTLNNAVNGTKIYCKLIASDDICTDKPNVTSDTIVINCIGVGTNDLNLIVQNFDVFPNPNKGVFTVKLNTIKTEKIELNILNYLGQTIKSEFINSNNYSKEFDLTDVPKGIYLIKLTINGQSLVKRMSVF
jgi:uncharacterized repeat protein (TIGR01451 family)